MSGINNGISDLLQELSASLSPAKIVKSYLDAKISADIIKIRIGKGMSQKEFADKIGVTEKQVSRWESGTCDYNTSTLAKITAALDLNCNIELSEKQTHPV